MAKEEKKQEEKPAAAEKAAPIDGKKSGSKLVLIIILLLVVVICGGAGFATALFVPKQTAEESQEPVNNDPKLEVENPELAVDSVDRLDYQIESVVACLDEPSLSRYVRIALTLQMAPSFDKENGIKFLDSNQPILRDWLTTYLAGLSLVQVQGSRNLEKIKLEIFENFNRILFKDKKPLIDKILFKEFVVQ